MVIAAKDIRLKTKKVEPKAKMEMIVANGEIGVECVWIKNFTLMKNKQDDPNL